MHLFIWYSLIDLSSWFTGGIEPVASAKLQVGCNNVWGPIWVICLQHETARGLSWESKWDYLVEEVCFQKVNNTILIASCPDRPIFLACQTNQGVESLDWMVLLSTSAVLIKCFAYMIRFCKLNHSDQNSQHAFSIE